jgi:molybdopterin-biosynthesis enzyme MoeA-like protein
MILSFGIGMPREMQRIFQQIVEPRLSCRVTSRPPVTMSTSDWLNL